MKRPSAASVRKNLPPSKIGPLRRIRHESFVQAFAEHFDGEKAARAAGYKGRLAARIWPVLLQRPDVRLRLQTLRDGAGRMPTTPAAMLRELMQSAFFDQSRLFIRHPMTGEMIFDPDQASAQDLNALQIDHVSSLRNGQRHSTTRLRSPGRRAALAIAARRLGLSEPDKEALEEDPWSSIIRAAQGTPFPIATARNRRNKDDD